ncbi:competence/damage-inducible protein A [Lentilitoribacter sp. EG35]|uniref:competence/damage-inducible protein A n=1 Tax=Lentilitoribacter sp. EG35 TaxID=3234192 RepID=UPI0034610884
MSNTTISASALAIGDELLSGRTRDKNIGHLAVTLTSIGVTLREVRIVQDDERAIVEALNDLRSKYDYVFTSGGIGPTHDDITADSISKAFDLPCIYEDKAMELLSAHYKQRGLEFTAARQRMARMPEGAVHIHNPVSVAPGFHIKNVYVMAGVPKVFEAMLSNVIPALKTGTILLSDSIISFHGEGDIGTPLGDIQNDNPDISIGSYPKFTQDGGYSSEIVVRGLDNEKIAKAILEIKAMLNSLD